MAISHANVGDNVLYKTNEVIDELNSMGDTGIDVIVEQGTQSGYDYVLWKSTKYEQRGFITIPSGSSAVTDTIGFGRSIMAEKNILLTPIPMLPTLTIDITNDTPTGITLNITGSRSKIVRLYYEIKTMHSEPGPK